MEFQGVTDQQLRDIGLGSQPVFPREIVLLLVHYLQHRRGMSLEEAHREIDEMMKYVEMNDV